LQGTVAFNIHGQHYRVRVAHQVLTCHRDPVDLLVSFEAESLAR
jgi:hypothetical protein